MATITEIKRKNGRVAHSIRFTRNGRRHVLTMESAFTRTDVEEVALAIDDVLVAERMGESVKRRTKVFFENAPPVILDKLVAVGIVDAKPHLLFSEVLLRFMDDIQDKVKPNTLASYNTLVRVILQCIDARVPVDRISDNEVATATDYFKQYSPLTAKLFVAQSRKIWNWLIQEGYCQTNIWKGVKLHGQKIQGRDFEIPEAWSEHILNSCPSQQWRVLFALWRYGGLRRNEPLALTWSDVNWERRRLCVHSTKTERFEGRESRIIPLFPEIERELSDLFAMEVGDRLITLSSRSFNTVFARIVQRAGYKPWPRLFQNLRATRENELIERGLPAHVVGEWLGHTAAVQAKHYLRVLDSYYETALEAHSLGEAKTKPILVKKG